MEIIKITPKDLGKLDITDYCRKLIKEGKDVDSRLELYRERDTPDVIVTNIGFTAKWKVKETDRGPKFVRYNRA